MKVAFLMNRAFMSGKGGRVSRRGETADKLIIYSVPPVGVV